MLVTLLVLWREANVDPITDALKGVGAGAGAGAGPGPETDLLDDIDIRLDERRDSVLPETARRVGLGGIGGASLPPLTLTDETDRLE